ncbi:right-handed parallel beta-helix repeat-containing protein, partial [Bacteroidota bacterium]
MKTPKVSLYCVAAICLFLSFVNLLSVKATTVEVSGYITENTTWSDDTVKVTGSIIISDNITLTIEPRTTIIFHGYFYLRVDGTIRAEGQEGDTILFTRIDTSGFHNMYDPAGSWQGIIIDNYGQIDDNDTSVFNHCIIEFAKGTPLRSWDEGGAMYIHRTGRVKIENCVIRNNSSYTSGGGICLGTNAHIILKNSFIHHNKAYDGGGMDAGLSSYARIEFNTLYKNHALNYGGGIFSKGGRALFVNNLIANNYAGNSGGGNYIQISPNQYIGNIIINNEASIAGGGMLISNSPPEIINNTICNNKSNTGSGIMFEGISRPTIVNTIFWGGNSNDNAQINLGNLAKPDITFCLLEGGKDSIKMAPGHDYYGKYDHNLATDPLFLKATEGAGIGYNGLDAKWCVQATSPCLNTGSNELAGEIIDLDDPYHNDRLQYAIIDIGAVETKIPFITESGEITHNTSWVADSIFVTGDILIRDSATLTISPGSVVAFKGYYAIINEGVLHAVGAPENMIKFTVYDTEGFSNPATQSGSWKGIRINNTDTINGIPGRMWDNDTTRLDYCILEYGNNSVAPEENKNGGALRIQNFSKIILSNSILRNNIASSGGAITITGAANPIITNNLIYNNFSIVNGGGISIAYLSEPVISNNIISNNKAGYTGGAINTLRSKPVIVNNVICNNTANRFGAVRFNQSEAVFVNNTVVNNKVTNDGAGGIYLKDCSPDIINSIIWGNEDISGITQISTDENSSFYNCVIEDYPEGINLPGDYSGVMSDIIDLDPEFISPSSGVGADFDGLVANWSLGDFSPCINAGNSALDLSLLPSFDIAGIPRLNGSDYDLGAYEHQ